jgi:hypothetical protein
VFNFAYAMSFGNEGEHRNHRTGGSIKRKKGEIFINAFQGKLSELAIYNLFHQLNIEAYKRLSAPDFETYGLGAWDDSDIALDNIKLSIKSTAHQGNLLLLETKDWNSDGEYLPNKNAGKNCLYDYFILVRIKPDGKRLMKKNKLFYENTIDKDCLWKIVDSPQWQYDVAGYISHKDLIAIINNGFVLPKNSMLNGRTKMDAENYYVQSGDMKNLKHLILSL